jgi:hypothetical protein
MKVKQAILLFLLLPGALNFGCKSLKHVNDFSIASQESLRNYTTIPYSYYRNCRDMCDLNRQTAIITGKQQFNPVDTLTCDCKSDLAKDKDAGKAYTVLILYFEGLQQLSDNKKFIYSTGNLVSALGKIKAIEDPQLQEPVTKIADLLLNMATRAYRSRSLQELLNESKVPVDKLLGDLILNNRLLQGKYKGYYGAYLTVMMRKYAGPHVEPRQQLDDYVANSHEVEKAKVVAQDIQDFNAILGKVKEGHLKLADERLKIKDKALITYLFTQAKELKANISKL